MISTVGKKACREEKQVTVAQIAFALKRAKLGTKVDKTCGKASIGDATFHKWRHS